MARQVNAVETRQFKHFNENEFQQDLAQAFNYFTYNSDPNLAWQEWKDIFLSISDNHAPYRTRKVRNEHCSWLNNEIKKLKFLCLWYIPIIQYYVRGLQYMPPRVLVLWGQNPAKTLRGQ